MLNILFRISLITYMIIFLIQVVFFIYNWGIPFIEISYTMLAVLVILLYLKKTLTHILILKLSLILYLFGSLASIVKIYSLSENVFRLSVLLLFLGIFIYFVKSIKKSLK